MLWFDDFTDLDTSELLTVASAEIAPQAERCIPDSSAKQVRVVAQHSAWRIGINMFYVADAGPLEMRHFKTYIVV